MLGGCGGLARTDFLQFLLCVGVVFLKELILTVSTLDRGGGLKRTDFLTGSNFGGCGGLARTAFLTVLILGGCGGLERTDF